MDKIEIVAQKAYEDEMNPDDREYFFHDAIDESIFKKGFRAGAKFKKDVMLEFATKCLNQQKKIQEYVIFDTNTYERIETMYDLEKLFNEFIEEYENKEY